MSFEDRFQLKVPLGESSGGGVWSAEDKLRKRPVAVTTLDEDAPAVLRARMDALVDGGISRVHSTVLARVVDAGRQGDGTPYLATELVEGGVSLAQRLAEGPAIAGDVLVRLTAEMLTALAKLHEAGFAHGDIEPGNVLLIERGDQISPRLVGLGLNRALVREGVLELESPDHLATLGTMAPEQAGESAASTPSGDVFSTAAVLYTALTGRPPFRGADVADVRDAAARRHPPRIGKLNEALDNTALAAVIDKALSRDPEDRFADANALASALRGALIRTRTIRELTSTVGPMAMDADESDDALSDERATGPTPDPEPQKLVPKAAPSLAKGAFAPLKPIAALPRAAAKPLKPIAPPSSTDVASKPKLPLPAIPPRAPDPGSLEFESVSGLLEIPSRPPPEPGVEPESLEFERVSGLVEIVSAPPPKRPTTVPPPSQVMSPADEDEDLDDAADSEDAAAGSAVADVEDAKDAAGTAEAEAEAEAAAGMAADEDASDAATAEATDSRDADEPSAGSMDDAIEEIDAVAVSASELGAKRMSDPGVRRTEDAPKKRKSTSTRPPASASSASTAQKSTSNRPPAKRERTSDAPPPLTLDPPRAPATGSGGAGRWLVMAPILLITLGLGYAAWRIGTAPSEPVSDPTVDREPTADPLEAEPPNPTLVERVEPPPSTETSAIEETPPAPAAHLVTLRGLPPGAHVTVDGFPNEGTMVSIGERPVTVEVTADGFEPYSTELGPDAASILNVNLTRAAAPSAGSDHPAVAHEGSGQRGGRGASGRSGRGSRGSTRGTSSGRGAGAGRTTSHPGAVSNPGF